MDQEIYKPGTITVYDANGMVLGEFPMPEMTVHDERHTIIVENGINEYSHYEMHGAGWGYLMDGSHWVDIDKATGKILKAEPIPETTIHPSKFRRSNY